MDNELVKLIKESNLLILNTTNCINSRLEKNEKDIEFLRKEIEQLKQMVHLMDLLDK